MKVSKQELSAVADKAHTICKAASKAKGGKHSEYLSEAFKIAWSMLKAGELFIEKVYSVEEFSALIAKNSFQDDIDHGDEENNDDVTGFEDECEESDVSEYIGKTVYRNGAMFTYVSHEGFSFKETDDLTDVSIEKDGEEWELGGLVIREEDGFVFVEAGDEDVIIVVPEHKLNIKKSTAVSKLFSIFDDPIYTPDREWSDWEMDVYL